MLPDPIVYVKDKSGNGSAMVREARVGRRGLGPGGGTQEGLWLLSRQFLHLEAGHTNMRSL